jgi:peptide deformylase
VALLKIARLGHPVIRKGAESVGREELRNREIQRFIDDMIDTMRDADGVGIAAPQVHVAKEIVVIEVTASNPRYSDQKPIPLKVIVNPRVTANSNEFEEGWEGCLSVPDLRGRVPRWVSLEVTGWDRHGNDIRIRAWGFYARVIQHEVDHLNGVVFLDRLPDLSSLTHLREYQRYWLESEINSEA